MYLQKLKTVLLLLLTFCVYSAEAQQVTINALSSPVCAGSTYTATVTQAVSFPAANIFTVELSDENGDFTTPIYTYSVNAASISSVPVDIPAGAVTGANYWLRIKYSTTPTDIDTSSTFNIVAPTIVGSNSVCESSVATFTGSPSGGTWSSSNTAVGTITTVGGVFSAKAGGTTNVVYTTAGCIAQKAVVVDTLPDPIFSTLNPGQDSVCVGATIALESNTPGGVWSSSNGSNATVSGAGLVTGASPGTTTISYTNSFLCSVTKVISVNQTPVFTTTVNTVCFGNTVSLTASPAGTWQSTSPGIASIGSSSGVVTGLGVGTSTISYVTPKNCFVTRQFTVNALPNATTGTDSVCMRLSTTLSNSTAGGGTWSALSGLVTVGAGTGIVTAGSTAGTVNVVFTATSTGCKDTTLVKVKQTPNVTISGLSPSAFSILSCNNDTVAATLFNSDMASGTTFQYYALNGDTSVFKPNSFYTYRAGNTQFFPSYRAVNAGFARDTSFIVVKAINGGCATDLDTTLTFAVNPTPRVNATSDAQITCNNSFSSITFSGPSSNTTYRWAINNTAIANPVIPSTGLAIFPSFNASSASGVQTATVTVTPEMSSGGCIDPATIDTFVISISAIPTIPVTTTPICDGDVFNYSPGTPTVDTTYTWQRLPVAGVSNSPVNITNGTNDINQTLVSTLADTVSVVYVYTVTAGGCIGNDTVKVTVKPTPHLLNLVDTVYACDEAVFNFTPASNTTYTTPSFSWVRNANGTYSSVNAASGTGAINDAINNLVNDTVHVVYVYSVTASGCSNNNTDTVRAIINPTPGLGTLSFQYPVMCNKDTINFPLIDTTAASLSGWGNTTFQWSRAAVSGISNSAGAGIGTLVKESLEDTTDLPVAAMYTFTLTTTYASSPACTSNSNVVVTINPTPRLLSALSDTVCNGATFIYTPAFTTGTAVDSVIWHRDAITSVVTSSGPSVDTFDIDNVLGNVTDNFEPTTYTYLLYTHTPYKAVCPVYAQDSQRVSVTVLPTPRIVLPHTTAKQCDGLLLQDSVSSPTEGTISYTWRRLPGVVTASPASIDTSTYRINEILVNTTRVPQPVDYHFTLTVTAGTHSCLSDANANNITDTVNPTPKLEKLDTTFCSEDNLVFRAAKYSYTGSGVQYAWRVNGEDVFVKNISGFGNKFEGKSDTFNLAISSNYNRKIVTLEVYYDMNHRGCVNTDTVTMYIKPRPSKPQIDTSLNEICRGAMSRSFRAGTNNDTGIIYTWQATKDFEQWVKIEKVSSDSRFAIISFSKEITPGATKPQFFNSAYYRDYPECTSIASATIKIRDTAADDPSSVYYNPKSNVLVCLNNDVNSINSYQWGYEQKGIFKEEALNNGTRQSYIIPDKIDTAKNDYWVLTSNKYNRCIQKSYYKPDISPTYIGAKPANVSILAYPNPTSNTITLELSTGFVEGAVFEIFDVLTAKKVISVDVTKAWPVVDASLLPNGNYLVVCTVNGKRIATTQIVKN